ncbi:restriction endonuclease subunit S [Acinetobacter sp. AS5]|uniref:restriction endonuclease subunit S n=1 Tax=Acinetobacter sp. AS5 TaxID=3029187 RepID=UPI003B77D6D3
MAKYQKYAEYKDSGVEWLGEIPRHWDSKPLKYLCTYNDEVLPETTAKDAEIQYIDIGSVSAVDGISKIETMIFKDAPSRARRIVRDGDVIVSTVRTYLEAIAPINNPPENLIVSTGFAVIRPNQYLYKSFASYCLRAKGFIKEVVARSVGVSYPAINSSDLVNITIPSIEYAEQVKIANFLDHETAKIDSLIAKQEKLIEILKEKRQAVISHAVTKGLNPNVAMKDSGVEWLGQVPEHWLTPRLKQLIKYGSSISYGIVQPGDPLDEGVPFIQTTNISKGIFALEDFQKTSVSIESNYPRSRLEGGEVILGIRASIGAAFVVPMSFKGVNLSRGIARIVPNNLLRADFLVWYFKSNAVDQYWGLSKQGSTFSEVSIETVKELNVVIPPLVEQADIAKYLTNESNKFEKLINSAETQKILLQERRTALISSAVTGKIDVRHHASRPSGNDKKQTEGI